MRGRGVTKPEKRPKILKIRPLSDISNISINIKLKGRDFNGRYSLKSDQIKTYQTEVYSHPYQNHAIQITIKITWLILYSSVGLLWHWKSKRQKGNSLHQVPQNHLFASNCNFLVIISVCSFIILPKTSCILLQCCILKIRFLDNHFS